MAQQRTRQAQQQQGQEVSRANALVRYEKTVSVAMPGVEEILPATIKPGRFQAAAVMAFKKDPDLGGCREETVIDALREAATDGLLLDGKEAALVVRGKRKYRPGQWICAYMPMYQGMIKKIRGAGPVRNIEAHVVYRNDDYTRTMGSSPSVEHIRAVGERGEPYLVYAIAFFKDGSFEAVEMDEDEIEKVRSKAETQNVWDEWEMEMWKKSVLRRIYKQLPKEGLEGVEHLIEAHDADYDLTQPGDDDEPEDPGDETIDTETGEVIDQEEETPPPRQSRAEQAAARRQQRSQQRARKQEGSRTRSRQSRSQAQSRSGPDEPVDDYQPPGQPAGESQQGQHSV